MRISWAELQVTMETIIRRPQVDMAKVMVDKEATARMEGRGHINSSTEIGTAMSVIIKSRGMEDGIGTTANIERLQSISLNPIKRIAGRIRTIIASEITTNTSLTTKTIINNKIVRCFLQATRTFGKTQKSAM